MNVLGRDLATARRVQEIKPTPHLATEAETPKPKLRVVPSLRTRRRRASVLGLVACTLTFGFMIGITAFQAQLALNQIEVDRVSKELRAEQLMFDHSRLEIARLQAPDVILARAKQLGMVVPTVPAKYIPPSSNTVTEVLIATAGGPEAEVPSGSTTRPDWSAYKKIVGENP